MTHRDLGAQRQKWMLEHCQWCLDNGNPISTNQELGRIWDCDPSNIWVILKKLQVRGYLVLEKRGRRLWPVRVVHEPNQSKAA